MLATVLHTVLAFMTIFNVFLQLQDLFLICLEGSITEHSQFDAAWSLLK